MTTWSSKPLAALMAFAALGACDVANIENGLFEGFLQTEGDGKPPLAQALMMQGNVTLVPPQGFCIDANSLDQNFALMARCDALGADSGSAGAPASIVMISFTKTGSTLPSATDVTAAAGLAAPDSLQRREARVIFRTAGNPPTPDLDAIHWRSVAQIGGYTMGAAIFGQTGQRATSTEGAAVLEQLITRTMAKSQTS